MWLLPSAQAEALQPNPAWRQGGLPTGFSWQLFSTPLRPNDRIELRLRINTGSLAESSQQIGSAHLLPRLSLGHSGSLSTLQLRSLWQQSLDDERPLPLAISSYDFTIYNLSLPNNRPDLLKDALVWLSDITGKLALNEHGVQVVMSVCIDPVGTFPPNLQDAWWRCRLKGSTLAAQDPAQPVKLPVNIAQLSKLFAAYAHTGTDEPAFRFSAKRCGGYRSGAVSEVASNVPVWLDA